MAVDFSVTLTGGDELQRAFSDARPGRGKWLADAFVAAAQAHRRVMVRDFLSGPSSRTRLGTITGRLIDSIKIESLGRRGVRIGSDLFYAEVHEFAFDGRRSWLLRSLEQVFPELYEDTILTAWEREFTP